MKASDTVMKKREQARVWLKTEQDAGFLKDCDITGVLTDPSLFGETEQMHSQANAKAQAKVTWEMCIKEVVEWIKNNLVDECHPIPVGDSVYLRFRKPLILNQWQSKLKEWEG